MADTPASSSTADGDGSTARIQRSRRGCWTCKRRHKKCDEGKPACARCLRAKMPCEGYNTRLTWGSSSAENQKSGIILNPKRPQSVSRKVAHERGERNAKTKGKSSPRSIELADADHNTVIPNATAETLHGKYRSQISTQLGTPDERTTERLVNEFRKTGYLTLTGRSGDGGMLESDVLPMCETSMPLRHTIAAYQASLSDEDRHLMPVYIQLGISGYTEDLRSPGGIHHDVTLVTGILLCSASISALYIWTPLLRGLHAVLEQRGLLSTEQHSPLLDHLLEVIALLDVPHFVINRTTDSMRIWITYVAPRKLTGIQEMSGLPYSLLNLICDIEAPDSERKLLEWPGEPCQELVQVHLWEAFRVAAVLHRRALRADGVNTPTDADSVTAAATVPDQTLRMRVLAACQAILDSRDDAFPDVKPLGAALLFPLFVVGLSTDEGTPERSLTSRMFGTLVKKWEPHKNGLAWEIMVEVWKRSKTRAEVPSTRLAEEFAAELNIEMYLY